MGLTEQLQQHLDERKAAHLYRARQVVDSPQGIDVTVEGKSYLNFCSNDYLGLANHPAVIKSAKQALEQFGVGSGAAHLVTGHMAPHHALEEELAEFVQRPRALLFSTGYMANLGVVSALLDRHDAVLEDRLNHASLIDAGLLSRARLLRYGHADMESLQTQLQNSDARRKLIVSDGVFSMDGDIAPLPQVLETAARHKAWLMVDDAHGLGVLGEHGRGSLEHFNLGDEVDVLVGTLGKAFGTFGAFVAGSEALIETLIQQARSYIYTTALPPAIAQATRTSLHLIQNESWRRDKLRQLIRQFRQGAKQLGFNMPESETPIQPLLIGESDNAVALSSELKRQGILISAIRPPTVPDGTARLRVTLCAEHDERHVNQLLNVLSDNRGLKPA